MFAIAFGLSVDYEVFLLHPGPRDAGTPPGSHAAAGGHVADATAYPARITG
jgi:hypothetical protein